MSLLKDLSYSDLSKALLETFEDFYGQLTPDQQAQIHFHQVVNSAQKVLQGQSPFGSKAAHLTTLAVVDTAGKNACLLAMGIVIADVFTSVFQLAGINAAESRAAARSIVLDIERNPTALRGIQLAIHNLSVASSTTDKAKIMWSILTQTKRAIGLKGITNALKNSMHWYDWIITGVTVVAQLTIWFASDGTALIAELALEAAFLAQLVADAVKAGNACSGVTF